ncbi:related to protein priB [Ramularia collo-cygni]|uniref:Related to protein priB n=1 Tax=Ramularia collo-cygni TaxID=112498 RepID=A0A2D3V5C0_9PEZI|nr:related to protein priB [Ramularia collo-cygni]CZT21885.1 related to protein priB [Ramularia collo-cygni]
MTFEDRTKVYLKKHCGSSYGDMFTSHEGAPLVAPSFHAQQGRVRAMLGCGMCYQSLPVLACFVEQSWQLGASAAKSNELSYALCSVDGDIIQALTAIQKTLLTPSGSRRLDDVELEVVSALFQALLDGKQQFPSDNYPYARSLSALQASGLVSGVEDTTIDQRQGPPLIKVPSLNEHVETFKLGEKRVPRLFSGLWQLSSPSWGTASSAQIQSQFSQYASYGFTAYDMADHYGDAEIIFGKFRAGCSNPELLFGATKYCVFTSTSITREVVEANVTERCRRMLATYVDLLQFHWQDYGDAQYMTALNYLQNDPRVRALGLCNFDTHHMRKILDSGINISTNQVQFSLIDSRPLMHMAEVCKKHNVKLLTYGTLLGGFLAEKWLGKAEPASLFAESITPSQRKYYEMILNWGSWVLFQELLEVLNRIARRYGVSVSNVATRWVLDFEIVGAVIVGTRWGVSDNAGDNLKVYGLNLDDTDRDGIESVLRRSRRDEMVEVLGDCGGEYR